VPFDHEELERIHVIERAISEALGVLVSIYGTLGHLVYGANLRPEAYEQLREDLDEISTGLRRALDEHKKLAGR
jgi:hypothetical protein